MNIALFGGTFDPVHTGHLKAARAAARRFHLDRILFVPSGNPPHKFGNHLTSFEHRYAMVALACAGDPRFVPSLLEAPTADGRPQYSVSTIRKVKRLVRRNDRLYFLIGVDAFLDLPHWKDYRQILDRVDFIVVSRPGYSVRKIRLTVPPDIIHRNASPSNEQTIRLRRSLVHVIRGMETPVASSDIRDAVRSGRRVTGLVPPLVEEYIRKEGLYLPAETRGRTRS
ncbi:MAG TPA: nicotinate-nucleotide adenylyltransferase [Terriglobia bacterium]|nr:nicotinate-nucleotide adenylyltransferase [Terriglobia bacterium]